MKPAPLLYGLALGSTALVTFTPWACIVAVAALLALVSCERNDTARQELEADSAVTEERVKGLEGALDKLKDTAAAVIKVERRTRALENAVGKALLGSAEE